MDDEIRLESIIGNVILEDDNDPININTEEGMPGKDATINGVNALTINGGENITISQVGNVATLNVDLSSIEDDMSYIHEQVVPSYTWTVNHGLGKYPSVSVVDSGGSNVIGDINHISDDELIISFGFPFGGKAFLN